MGLTNVDLRIFLVLVKSTYVPQFTYARETLTNVFMLEYLKINVISDEKLWLCICVLYASALVFTCFGNLLYVLDVEISYIELNIFLKCSMGRSKTAISSFIFNGLISGVVALRFWLNNANIKVNPTNWLAAYVLHNLLAYFQNWIGHKIAQSMSQTHKVPTMIPTFLWFCRSFVMKPQTNSKQ